MKTESAYYISVTFLTASARFCQWELLKEDRRRREEIVSSELMAEQMVVELEI